MSTVADTIRAEHSNMATLLDILEHEIDLFHRGERPDHDVILAIVDYFLSYPDRCHHPKEDAVFRQLRQRDPEAADLVGNLEAEHEDIGRRLRHFQEAVQNWLKEVEMPRENFVHAARDFIANERRHMEMEERDFLPAAERLLSEADWAAVAAQIGEEADPLFGGQAAERFEELRQRIIRWESEDEAARAETKGHAN